MKTKRPAISPDNPMGPGNIYRGPGLVRATAAQRDEYDRWFNWDMVRIHHTHGPLSHATFEKLIGRALYRQIDRCTLGGDHLGGFVKVPTRFAAQVKAKFAATRTWAVNVEYQVRHGCSDAMDRAIEEAARTRANSTGYMFSERGTRDMQFTFPSLTLAKRAIARIRTIEGVCTAEVL